MLIVAENNAIMCGAIVAYDNEDTIIVFHPALTLSEQERFAQELLSEGEKVLWRERHKAVG